MTVSKMKTNYTYTFYTLEDESATSPLKTDKEEKDSGLKPVLKTSPTRWTLSPSRISVREPNNSLYKDFMDQSISGINMLFRRSPSPKQPPRRVRSPLFKSPLRFSPPRFRPSQFKSPLGLFKRKQEPTSFLSEGKRVSFLRPGRRRERQKYLYNYDPDAVDLDDEYESILL